MADITNINNWGGTPYQMPMLPLPQFDWSNNFSGGIFNFTLPSASAPAATKFTSNESYEDYKKRIEAELEAERVKFQKSSEERALSTQKAEEIKPLQEEAEKIDKQITDIKTAQKKDGSAVVRPDSKKLGFWGKASRWLGNAGSALKNMAKGIAGFEKDGSWNWKKCLRNVAITALAVGACFIPVVGPAIGYGLAAFGVGSAGVGIIKGASKLKQAKTEEEIDKAQQDICANAFIGITSAFGLRGVKGLKSTMQAEKALVAAKGGGFSGYCNAFGSKISDSWKNLNNWESKYQNKYKNLEASTKKNIADIDVKIDKINRTPGSNKAKRDVLYEKRNTEWQKLTDLKAFKNIKTKSELDQLAKTSSKDIKKLIQYKENMMRSKAAKPDKYTAELREYIPVPHVKKRWYKPSTWRKNDYQLAIGGKNPGNYKELLGLSLTSQASTVPKLIGEANREYSGPMLMSAEYTAEDAKEILATLEAQKAELEAKISGIKNIDLATYKNALAQKAKA